MYAAIGEITIRITWGGVTPNKLHSSTPPPPASSKQRRCVVRPSCVRADIRRSVHRMPPCGMQGRGAAALPCLGGVGAMPKLCS